MFRYCERGLDPADGDDAVCGLYAEEYLEPAGQTTLAELFALSGGSAAARSSGSSLAAAYPRAGRAGLEDGTYTLAAGRGICGASVWMRATQ